jgi:hypothetical protein
LPELTARTAFADASDDEGLAKWAEAAHVAVTLHEHGVERVMDIAAMFEVSAERRIRHLDESLAELPGAFARRDVRSLFWRMTCLDHNVIDADTLLRPLQEWIPSVEAADVVAVVEALTELLGPATTSAWQVGEALRRRAGLQTAER